MLWHIFVCRGIRWYTTVYSGIRLYIFYANYNSNHNHNYNNNINYNINYINIERPVVFRPTKYRYFLYFFFIFSFTGQGNLYIWMSPQGK